MRASLVPADPSTIALPVESIRRATKMVSTLAAEASQPLDVLLALQTLHMDAFAQAYSESGGRFTSDALLHGESAADIATKVLPYLHAKRVSVELTDHRSEHEQGLARILEAQRQVDSGEFSVVDLEVEDHDDLPSGVSGPVQETQAPGQETRPSLFR